MSAEETKRHEILVRALNQRPELDFSRQDFDLARTEILKGVADADQLTMSGIQLDNATAHIIARAKRSVARQIQLNGNYQILRVDWQQDNEVRIKVLGCDAPRREFVASFLDDSLERDQINLLKQAEWDRNKVYLSINATELRGEITTATIVGVTIQVQSST